MNANRVQETVSLAFMLHPRSGATLGMRLEPRRMVEFSKTRLLVIAPHPDDEAFGCGGLIHRIKKAGGEVYVLFLTVGTTQDFSQRGVSTADERMQEIERAAAHMRLDGYRIAFPGNEFHLQLDALPQKRLIHEIERGEKLSLEALKPSMLAFPSHHDYNQDHRAANRAAITATRPVSGEYKHVPPVLLEYELPYFNWAQTQHPTANFFMPLDDDTLAAKLETLALYASQMKTDRGAVSVYGAETLARMRGIHAGSSAAEAFVSRRITI